MGDGQSTDWEDNPDWSEYEARDLMAGERLIVVRAKLGLTQEATASMLGIPIATLRNWEQGRTEPDGPAKALIRLLYEHPREIQAWLTVV